MSRDFLYPAYKLSVGTNPASVKGLDQIGTDLHDLLSAPQHSICRQDMTRQQLDCSCLL